MKEKTYFEILEEMEQDKLKKFDTRMALGAICANLIKLIKIDETTKEAHYVISFEDQLYDIAVKQTKEVENGTSEI